MTINNFNSFEAFEAYAEEEGFDGYALRETWATGGQTGGSCWDTDGHPHYAIEGDREPDTAALDTFLSKVSPDLTFLEYRRLSRENVIIYSTKTENDYYGNYTTYGVRTVDLYALYNALLTIYEDRA